MQGIATDHLKINILCTGSKTAPFVFHDFCYVDSQAIFKKNPLFSCEKRVPHLVVAYLIDSQRYQHNNHDDFFPDDNYNTRNNSYVA